MGPRSRSSDAPADVILSVVIPAFNEAHRIGATVERVLRFFESRRYRSELIVVLDGGRPGSREEIDRVAPAHEAVRVIDNERNRGKGYSVRQGVLASRGRYVIFADADLSMPIEDAERFLDVLRGGADVAIGSRALPASSETGERQPLRHQLGRAFNWLVRTLAVPGLHDTQCGFKAFNGACARALFEIQRVDGFGFDVEVLRIAQRRSYRIEEVPVRCEYHQTSSVRKIRDGAGMMADVARTLWFDARGYYRNVR
jgi:dolichyl-phosphate beta-glucosyltransferase